jgi:molybdenum cofactor guanylyltransferase
VPEPMSKAAFAGAIIAGGRASRMGGEEKAFKTAGTRTILDRAIACLEEAAGAVIINASGDEGRFVSRGLPVVRDILTSVSTPLAGIHASLAWAAKNKLDWLVTVPADTPFLPRDLAPRLIAAAQVTGAAIATSGGQDHFVIGAWRASLKCDLEQGLLTGGLFRVKDWAARTRAARVEWPVTPYDPFFNVNTPEDLAEAERIAAEFDQ